MSFSESFNAQNNLQAIIYLVGTEIFGFHQTLQPWQPYKEGTHLPIIVKLRVLSYSWLTLLSFSKPQ